MINVYAFAWVPPFARGLVRDLRVRWALEEAGLPYRTTLIGEGPGQMPRDEYRKIQPYGQVPAIEDGELRFFESGAIVLHIAEKSGRLLPSSPKARIEALQWLFAALNTVEPFVQEYAVLEFFYPGQRWAEERRPSAEEALRRRLAETSAALGRRDYFAAEFSVADILMSSILRILETTTLVDEHANLAAYRQRCEARPAFARALEAQLRDFVDEPVAAAG